MTRTGRTCQNRASLTISAIRSRSGGRDERVGIGDQQGTSGAGAQGALRTPGFHRARAFAWLAARLGVGVVTDECRAHGCRRERQQGRNSVRPAGKGVLRAQAGDVEIVVWPRRP